MEPEDALQQFCAPSTHQTEQPNDFTPPHAERHVANEVLICSIRMAQRKAFHAKHFVGKWGSRLGKQLRELAANHQLDHAVARQLGERLAGDETTVAEDRDVVGNLPQLVELVRDVNDADVLLLELANQPEEDLDFLFRDRRGRLVHDNHP